METENMFRGFTTTEARKLEAKIKPGPILHRAALGEVNNKPSLLQQNKVNLKEQTHGLKKREIATSNLLGKLPVNAVQNEKENLPLGLPKKCKPIATRDESMEVEEENEKMQVEQLTVAFSSQMLNIRDIDEEDAKNPQLVSAYVKDIYNYLWELEREHAVRHNYLEGQKINGRMRGILIDWLVQVHLRFSLIQETLYLTVAIIDRFLQVDKTITKDKLQLVGVTAMFIASKYEEIFIPEISDFSVVTDKTFSTKDIRKMEVHMLTTLNFYLSFPLPLHFLRRDSKAGQVDSVHHTLAKYLIELTLPEYSFSSIKSSLTAAAALFLALKIIDDGTKWDDVISFYSGYSEKEILPVVFKLSSVVIKSNSSKQQAIRTKYKSARLMKVSDIMGLKPSSRLLRSYAERAPLV